MFSMPKFKVIAFDLGGVVFSSSNDTNIFSQNYIETELNPGIFDIIQTLSSDKKNKLIIISKAFPNNARKSKEILRMKGLDVFFNSIIFCEHISEKAEIAKAMKVNVMIDDRQDVLNFFPEGIKTILFQEDEVDALMEKICN